MIEQPLEETARACVIISGYFWSVAEAIEYLADAAAAFGAKAIGTETAVLWEDKSDPIEALRRAIEEKEKISELAYMAEEPADIEPPRKTPRPPKRLGPVNKVNYAENRPPRRARSSCYIRRH